MSLRESVSTLLIIALLSSCFVHANNLRSMTDRQQASDISRKVSAPDKARKDPIDRLSAQAIREIEQHAPLVEKYLLEGKLAYGESTLLAQLKRHTSDDQSRFGLGVLQFLRAVERLAQDLYHYGLGNLSTRGLGIPFLRLPVPVNPEPEALSYYKAHKIIQTFLDNLAQTEATLASITDANVKLPLHFGMIRLDLNGNGQIDEDESLWKLYASLTRETKIQAREAKHFTISFDRGDVHWLRGYCHLLMAMCELYLAHDSKETFECTAHIFFPKVESPYGFLSKGKIEDVQTVDESRMNIFDLIALVHSIRWNVVEPQRMTAALYHLEGMVAQSKKTWKWIIAETDDDREWIPNPKQTGVIPNVQVTEAMVNAWTELMSEVEKVLAGELLIPFWRGDGGRGVNLRKVFTEPRTLDLVLWVQGSAAAPYLERGNMTKIETWRRLQSAFGNQFPGFAIWFN